MSLSFDELQNPMFELDPIDANEQFISDLNSLIVPAETADGAWLDMNANATAAIPRYFANGQVTDKLLSPISTIVMPHLPAGFKLDDPKMYDRFLGALTAGKDEAPAISAFDLTLFAAQLAVLSHFSSPDAPTVVKAYDAELSAWAHNLCKIAGISTALVYGIREELGLHAPHPFQIIVHDATTYLFDASRPDVTRKRAQNGSSIHFVMPNLVEVDRIELLAGVPVHTASTLKQGTEIVDVIESAYIAGTTSQAQSILR